jgi:uncharacterized membrane protein YbhN (UPF0104 family)
MVEVGVRDEDGVDAAKGFEIHPPLAAQVEEPRTEERVGQQPYAVQVDEHRRMADVHDPRSSVGHEPVIVRRSLGGSLVSEALAAPAPAPRGRFEVKRLVVIGAAVVVLGAALNLLGWDIVQWLQDLWDTMTDISLGYLVAGLVAQTAQTTLVALAWLPILRYAYPDVEIPFKPVLAAYAIGVALNGFLPANIGTFVMMFIFLTFIPGSTFPGVFAGWLVHKIFFTLAGTFVYLYLFLSVPGSFDIELGNVSDHPLSAVIILVGGALLLVAVARMFWTRFKSLWEKAKLGGAVLTYPRVYLARVFLPEFLGWCAKLAVIGIFLAAYGIPVTFHTIMSVAGGNSLANVASFTPGAVGITQAVNSASLNDVTDPTTATAYSLGQQLITTAWNQVFAAALLIWAFGWTGGKQLVRTSYGEAKGKVAEQTEARRARKSAGAAGDVDTAEEVS